MEKQKRFVNRNGDIYINGWIVDCITCSKGNKCSEEKQRKNDYGSSCLHFSMIPTRCIEGCK